MSMTLDDLLRSLEKQAADQEGEKKEEDKKEDSAKDSGKENPFAKKDEEKKNEGSEKEDRVKEAQLQGSALAQEIMQKVASANITNKETEMNKSAAAAGKALADSLLEKLAGVGDTNTTDGVNPAAVPNKAQRDNAAMVAERGMSIQTTPTTDAKGDNGGSINQIFDAIIADAMAAGAATPHELDHVSTSVAEGAVEPHQAPAGTESEEVEKVAAVSALVNSGFDFDSAVEMVKAAEEEILFEEAQQVKQAAMAQLVEAGVDFELAAALVKEAAAVPAFLKPKGSMVGGKFVPKNAIEAAKGHAARGYSAAGEFGAMAGQDARAFGQGVRQAVTGKDATGKAVGRMGALGRAASTATGMAAGAGALGAGAAGAYALSREKKAAVSGLVEAGVDFDTAVDLVNAKSAEIYGA